MRNLNVYVYSFYIFCSLHEGTFFNKLAYKMFLQSLIFLCTNLVYKKMFDRWACTYTTCPQILLESLAIYTMFELSRAHFSRLSILLESVQIHCIHIRSQVVRLFNAITAKRKRRSQESYICSTKWHDKSVDHRESFANSEHSEI